MTTTKPKPLDIAPTQEQIEDRDLDLDSRTLENQARDELPRDLLRKIKKISYYTSENGLALDEACLLSDISFDKFQELLRENELVRKIIEMKKLQYKKDLMYTVSQKARTGDDKLALWLLERMFPEEFYITKRSSPGGSGEESTILTEAIQYIQKNGDNSPLISKTSIRSIVVKKDTDEQIRKKLNDILS